MEDDNDEEDVFADPLNNDPKASQASAMLKKHRRENTEHSNPNSYSWIIMRLAIMKLAQNQLQEFINIAGIEMQGEGDTRTTQFQNLERGVWTGKNEILFLF